MIHRFKRVFLCGSVLAGAGVILAAAGCGPSGPPPAATAEMPSVLLVVIDALRFDRLGCYGYERETSPNMDALADDPDAVRFLRHYAQAAWTKPSTASLFTGLYVFQHGVFKSHEKTTSQKEWFYTSQVIDENFKNIAELLQPIGMHTFAVVKTYHVVPKYGFGRGFDDFYHREMAPTERKRIKRTLKAVRKARGPFFGYLHLEGVHHPFRADTRHAGFMERHGFPYDEEARAAEGKDFAGGDFYDAVRKQNLPLDDQDVRFLDLIYDAEIRWVDEELMRPLFDGLKELEVYDNCMIIVTADHGEELYDHRSVGHSRTLYEEVVRIPMIVKFPREGRPSQLGTVFAEISQSIDVLPSVVRYLGGEPPAGLPGVDVFSGDSSGWAYAELKQKR
jgi:arylsulfatase A-like enzyme